MITFPEERAVRGNRSQCDKSRGNRAHAPTTVGDRGTLKPHADGRAGDFKKLADGKRMSRGRPERKWMQYLAEISIKPLGLNIDGWDGVPQKEVRAVKLYAEEKAEAET